MMAQNTKGKNNATTAQSSADITRQSIVFAITQEITNHITNELIIPSRNKSIKPKCVRPLVFRKEKIFSKEIHYIYVQQIEQSITKLQEHQPVLLKRHLILSSCMN